MDNNDSSIIREMQRKIMESDIPETEKSRLLKTLIEQKGNTVNLMITGATGCGKSSTINALFDLKKVAKVGETPNPETMDITCYELPHLILWDSPGLGDGKEADERHAKNIIQKLNEKDKDGNLLIDLVLVILDGSSRDLGTSYELINSVIAPNLGPQKSSRILVAINQADMAMKGKHWDDEKSLPDETLIKFLDEKAESVKQRIKEGTGLDVAPIYYSAGFMENGEQSKPYNISKLLDCILRFVPKEKRVSVMNNINEDNFSFITERGFDVMDFGENIVGWGGDFAENVIDKMGLVGAPVAAAGLAASVVVGAAAEVVGGAVSIIGGIFDGIGDLFS